MRLNLDTARELAELHRLLASELPPDSRLRGLVLRCATHWSRIGAMPRNGLAIRPHAQPALTSAAVSRSEGARR
ncbi:MAG TPA: hypothetical protein VIJ21_08690 [Solirubrobacterales bacterium]